MFWLSPFDLISVAEVVLRVTKFNVLSTFRPITPSIWPQMKECSEGVVFVSSRRSIFIYKSSQSEFICKSYSQYGLDRPETKILRLTPDTCWWVSDVMREQFGLQDGLELKKHQHEKVSTRRADRFSYIIRLNPRSYVTWGDKSRSGYIFGRVKSLPSEWKLTGQVKA